MSKNYTSWNIYTIKISYNNSYNLFLGIIRVQVNLEKIHWFLRIPIVMLASSISPFKMINMD